jgi:hypothetical protein
MMTDPQSHLPQRDLPSRGLEVFPVAIGHYTDSRHADLTHDPERNVDAETAAVAELFAEFGGDCVDWDTPIADRTGDQVIARLTHWARSRHPRTVLYWVGHGWSDGQHAALAHTASPAAVGHQGITPHLLTDFLAQRADSTDTARDAWAIIIIDTCQSARFVQLLDAQVNQRLHERRFLLIGVSPHGSTTLGQFSATLRTTLTDTFRAEADILLWDLARELRRTLPHGAEVIPKQIDHAILRRTRRPLLLSAPFDVINEIDRIVSDLRQEWFGGLGSVR